MAKAFNLTSTVNGMKCDTKSNLISNTTNKTQVFVFLSFALVLILIIVGTCLDVFDFGPKNISPSSSRSSSARTSSWQLSKTALDQNHYTHHELQQMLTNQTILCEYR
jgi:hypothetical protein